MHCPLSEAYVLKVAEAKTSSRTIGFCMHQITHRRNLGHLYLGQLTGKNPKLVHKLRISRFLIHKEIAKDINIICQLTTVAPVSV